MIIAIQISAFKDIEKIKILVSYFKQPIENVNIHVLIHVNALSDKKLHDQVRALSTTNINVHIIEPIIVKWSHISHVVQKIKGMQHLKEKSIKYDYYICVTESDAPIKSLKHLIKFIKTNMCKSFFFDFSQEYESIKNYFEYVENFKYKKRILYAMRILYNEINFSHFSLTHKWKSEFYDRNINENHQLSRCKKIWIKILRNSLVSLHSFNILKFVIWPNKKNYIRAQKWQFSTKIKNQNLKIYSEWQYSIISFFSEQYCEFILSNWTKYITQFEEIYAPDESFWISIAKNFPNEVGDCVFDWKPMLLGLSGIVEKKDNSELKLSWDYKDWNSIRKYVDTNVLFARRISSSEELISILEYLEIIPHRA